MTTKKYKTSKGVKRFISSALQSLTICAMSLFKTFARKTASGMHSFKEDWIQ